MSSLFPPLAVLLLLSACLQIARSLATGDCATLLAAARSRGANAIAARPTGRSAPNLPRCAAMRVVTKPFLWSLLRYAARYTRPVTIPPPQSFLPNEVFRLASTRAVPTLRAARTGVGMRSRVARWRWRGAARGEHSDGFNAGGDECVAHVCANATSRECPYAR